VKVYVSENFAFVAKGSSARADRGSQDCHKCYECGNDFSRT
jgi:hypothetical protein